MATRRQNLFGFGKKKQQCARKSGMTIGTAKRAAFAAGQQSGDTGGFKAWACAKGLSDRGNATLKHLEQEYRRGVEAGEAKVAKTKILIERKQAAKAKTGA